MMADSKLQIGNRQSAIGNVKILFLESVAGVAGDMFAASFVDAGLVTKDELAALPALLGLQGVLVEVDHPIKATMKTTHITVRWNEENWKQAFDKTLHHEHSRHRHHHEHHHHHDQSANVLIGEDAHKHWHTHYVDIVRLLENSKLDQQTKELAQKIFRLIAEAESAAHGMAIEDVAFHEVGTIDSILDVVMAAYCVGRVGPQKIYATPVKTGRGFVRMQHGTHPIPPPASARLLIGMTVAQTPQDITRENVELSTPTGIAILKALSPQFINEMPQGVVLNQGMGAGTMDLGSYPNVFRVTVLKEAEQTGPALPYEQDEVIEICCNIDDDTAERIAWLAETLLKRGALDVWTIPITGKKGRAAVCLSVLCETEKQNALADFLLRQSATFGARMRKWDRLKLSRRFEKRATPQGEVTYKIGMTTSGEIIKEKPEFDDARVLWESNLDS
jgi:hypothetical protein